MLIARARRNRDAQPARPASVFDEIYGLSAPALPDSVTQALAALTLAQSARGHVARQRAVARPSL